MSKILRGRYGSTPQYGEQNPVYDEVHIGNVELLKQLPRKFNRMRVWCCFRDMSPRDDKKDIKCGTSWLR